MTTLDLDSALTAMLEGHSGTSDINFTVGKPPQAEVAGKLETVPFLGRSDSLGPEDTEAIAAALMGESLHYRETLNQTGAVDCAFGLHDGRRFRVNIFSVRGNHAIVLRALPSQVPTLDEMGLPRVLAEIPKLLHGMVLVVGATGSGKSTTLAAIINEINRTRPVHVLTLEDPVEFVHRHQLATVNQRELGVDFPAFADGLKSALRQAPKVILVGEMRDRESMEIGLKAAETGHLVLSTLHTIDAGQTINRIVGMFENQERGLIRMRLAETLRYVVAQRLLPRDAGGRVAALEIMGSSLRSRELIVNGEDPSKTFAQIIADARGQGWQTFDQHIVDLFAANGVTSAVARAYASDASSVARELDRIRATRGDVTAGIGDLQMLDLTPEKK